MTEDKPALDPAQVRMQRVLKSVVIALGALIVVILGIVVFTVFGRVGDMSDDDSTPARVTKTVAPANLGNAAVALPVGATIEHMAIGDGVLALHIRKGDGTDEVLLVDLATGAIKGKIALTIH